MLQPGWIEAGIAVGNRFHCRTKIPLIHNCLNLSLLFLILTGVGVVAYGSTLLSPWIYIPLASLALGFLFLNLFILVIHEASHNLFLLNKSWKKQTRWNELFGGSVSILFSTNFREHWEIGHLIHHLHPIESVDRQICNPRTGRELLHQILGFLLKPGFIFVSAVRGGGTEYDCPAAKKYPIFWSGMVVGLVFWVLVIWLSIHFLSWAFPVALFFSFRVLAILTVLKSALEHGGEIGHQENPYLRQKSSVFPLRYLLLPLNICYHFEHHLNYWVPWYDLGKYHRELVKIIPADLQPYFFNRKIWKQISGETEDIPSASRALLSCHRR